MATETIDKSSSSDLNQRLQALSTASIGLNGGNPASFRTASTETRVGDAATATATCTILPGNDGTIVNVGLNSHQFPFFGSRVVTVSGTTSGQLAVDSRVNLVPTMSDGAIIRLEGRQSAVLVDGVAGHLVSPFPTLVVPSKMEPMVVNCTPQVQR